MKYYYIELEDCQNNSQIIVKVWASSRSAAEAKALRAIHRNDTLYELNREEVAAELDNGVILINEDGEEEEL